MKWLVYLLMVGFTVIGSRLAFSSLYRQVGANYKKSLKDTKLCGFKSRPMLNWCSWLWHLILGEQISGQDKPSPLMSTTPASNSSHRPRSHLVPINNMEISQHSARLPEPLRFSAYQDNVSQGSVFFSSLQFLISFSSYPRKLKCVDSKKASFQYSACPPWCN
jgi:hypothetical protein